MIPSILFSILTAMLVAVGIRIANPSKVSEEAVLRTLEIGTILSLSLFVAHLIA